MARIETLMTPDLLEQSFRKHLVWKVWARLSIDNLLFDFDLCAMVSIPLSSNLKPAS